MHYYIDGYNLLFRGGASGATLQDRREEIIEELNRIAERFDLAITVVFDAMHQPEQSARSHYKSLEIVFTSKRESADHHLLRLIEEDSHPSQLTLVSSDRELAWKARILGAHTETVENFLQQTTPARTSHRKLVQKKGFHPLEELDKLLPKKKPTKEKPKPPPPPKAPKKEAPSDPLLAVFQERYEEIREEQAPTELDTSQKKRPAALDETEEQRWLRLFEERLRKKDKYT